jgi:hypothetical protein
MADLLTDQGRINGMEGIRTTLDTLVLLESVADGGRTIDILSVLPSDFMVSTDVNPGLMVNSGILNFTIAEGDVDKEIARVQYRDSGLTLIELDLDAPVPLTTAGEAEFAAEALRVRL